MADEIKIDNTEEIVKTKKNKIESHILDWTEKVGTSEIIYMPINTLTLLEANPRLIGKSELTKLANSIEADKGFFESRPCLVNKVGEKLIVYAGNMRIRAAIMLGWKLVPCIVDEIDPNTQDLRMFKDNIHAGEFDMRLLLKTFELGYLQHDIGMNFSKADLSKYLKEDSERKKREEVALEDFNEEDLDFDGGFDNEEDGDLFIASKFTNGTKPDALHFRQWEIPMSKDDSEWFGDLIAEHKKRTKSTNTFWRWFIEKVQENNN